MLILLANQVEADDGTVLKIRIWRGQCYGDGEVSMYAV